MNVNIWIALSTSAKNAINTRLRWNTETDGEYTGPVSDTEYRIFRRMAHHSITSRMWKTPTLGGKTWHLFSLTFDLSGTNKNKLKDALDWLAANRGNLFQIVGAWHWSGRQVGTQWELDQDGNRTGNTTGTPTYPINTSQLLKFMPDIIEYDNDGNVTSITAATAVTDVNLEQGQFFRRFQP